MTRPYERTTRFMMASTGRPAVTHIFQDDWSKGKCAEPWAEQAYKDELIPNCGTSDGKPKFCPKDLVTRGLGAYMIVRAKSLTMP